MTRAEIFVDSREAAVHESGDLVIPTAAGTIGPDAVRADLFQLCQGEHPGRSGPEAITMFENGGGGHLDLMTAQHLWASRSTSDDRPGRGEPNVRRQSAVAASGSLELPRRTISPDPSCSIGVAGQRI